MTWISVEWPLALWGLLLVPLVVLATIRSRAVLSGRMLYVVTAVRSLAIALVVLALADTRIHWPTDKLAVATVLDVSESISASEGASASLQLRRAVEEAEDAQWVDLSSISAPGPGRGDLGERVSTAVALLPRDRARRIVIATDGRTPPAEILPVVEEAARAGVALWAVPIGESPPIDQVSIHDVTIPRLIREGESTAVDAHLFALDAQRVTLTLTIDGVATSQLAVDAPLGRSTHRLQVIFPDEGVRRVEVTAHPLRDTLAENNRWTSLARVVPPARVLLIRPSPPLTPPALQTVLEESRLQVDVVEVNQVPVSPAALDRYQLVILDETAPENLSEPQQRALRTWVEEETGSLITITGVNAVRRQPEIFREIEPIMPPRAIPESPPLELILVIDRSSSMSGRRLDMARVAGVAAVRALRADSRVGVVAFSSSADQVIAPVEMSHRDWVIGFISSIGSGGGTDIADALVAANTIAGRDPAYLHHVVLLSDGISSSGPAVAAAQALAWRGVSISTISLGSQNRLMADIAAIGGGRHHVARNPSQLPRLFVREAQYRQAPPFNEEETRPLISEPMDFLDGVDFSTEPPLDGYVIAEPRPGAETILVSPEGDPLLAHWYVGQGRVMSFTSATTGSWSDRWRQSAGFRRLWSQIAWDMLRQREQHELRLRIDPHPSDRGRRVITVTTPDPDNDTPPIVELCRSAAEIMPLTLVRRGPALWQVDVELGSGFIVWGRPAEAEEPVDAVGEDRPYPVEVALFGPDSSTLATMVELGGGRVVERPAQALEVGERVPTMRALRLPLLLAALIAYLCSLLLQRLPRNIKSEVARRRPGRKDDDSRNGSQRGVGEAA